MTSMTLDEGDSMAVNVGFLEGTLGPSVTVLVQLELILNDASELIIGYTVDLL